MFKKERKAHIDPTDRVDMYKPAMDGRVDPGKSAVMLAIKHAQQEEREKSRGYEQEMKEMALRHQADTEARETFLKQCRPASAMDYAGWLKGWLEKGGAISNSYNYPMSNRGTILHGVIGPANNTLTERDATVSEGNWWVLTRVEGEQLDVPALCGSSSFNLIIPADSGLEPKDISQHAVTFGSGMGGRSSSDYGPTSHNNFYFMNDFETSGGAFASVPLYTDVAAVIAEHL